jgi:hypothetical protein
MTVTHLPFIKGWDDRYCHELSPYGLDALNIGIAKGLAA